MPNGVYTRLSDADRFWQKVDRASKCWLWVAGRFPNGYGCFRPSGSGSKGAHVWAFEQAFGPIPDGFFVLHTCDIRPCVRNDEPGIYIINGIARPRFGHLWLGTPRDNMADMREKGRAATGDRHMSRTKPESLRRGDNHPARLHPENLARGDLSGSRLHPEALARGERHGNAKLTADQVRDIRRRWAEGGVTQTTLGIEYGVSTALIGRIVRGKGWQHVT